MLIKKILVMDIRYVFLHTRRYADASDCEGKKQERTRTHSGDQNIVSYILFPIVRIAYSIRFMYAVYVGMVRESERTGRVTATACCIEQFVGACICRSLACVMYYDTSDDQNCTTEPIWGLQNVSLCTSLSSSMVSGLAETTNKIEDIIK